jgi:hypothetical protein
MSGHASSPGTRDVERVAILLKRRGLVALFSRKDNQLVVASERIDLRQRSVLPQMRLIATLL